MSNITEQVMTGWVRKKRAKHVHYILPSGVSLCGRVYGSVERQGHAQAYPDWNPKNKDTCPTCALFFMDKKIQ